LILKTLARGPQHGYGIACHIQQVSDEVLRVEEGSLYPALHRMAGRVDQLPSGDLGQQPPSKVLPADCCGPQQLAKERRTGTADGAVAKCAFCLRVRMSWTTGCAARFGRTNWKTGLMMNCSSTFEMRTREFIATGTAPEESIPRQCLFATTAPERKDTRDGHVQLDRDDMQD